MKRIAMVSKDKADKIIVIIFYLLTVGFLSYSGMILLNPPTSFEENRLENFVKLPEFTLCPYGQHEPIESFEDVIIKIEDTKKKYSARLKWGNSFENM